MYVDGAAAVYLCQAQKYNIYNSILTYEAMLSYDYVYDIYVCIQVSIF